MPLARAGVALTGDGLCHSRHNDGAALAVDRDNLVLVPCDLHLTMQRSGQVFHVMATDPVVRKRGHRPLDTSRGRKPREVAPHRKCPAMGLDAGFGIADVSNGSVTPRDRPYL